MKRTLLAIMVLVSAVTSMAQTAAITLKAEVNGNERNLVIGLKADGKAKVDWGDGTLKETETIPAFDGWNQATVTGTPTGEGTIKVYGDGIVYFEASSRVDGAKVLSVDVTNAPDLEQLIVNTNKLTSIDITKNMKLQQLDIQNNELTGIDISKNTELTKLSIQNNKLTALDISKNQKLQTLYISDNAFEGTLDISTNPTLKSIYCLNNSITDVKIGKNTASKPYFSFNNCKLTTFDATGISDIANATLFLMGNELTSMTLPETMPKTMNISKNKFTLATLPQFKSTRYTYAPQADYAVNDKYNVGDVIDLSSQTDATLNTKFTVENATEPLVEGKDYTVDGGRITLLTAQTEPVYVTMTTEYFPKFTGTNTYKTASFTVGVATGISQATTGVKISSTDGGLTIDGLNCGDDVSVYSTNGAMVSSFKATSSKAFVPVANGLFIVKVNGKAEKVLL